MRRQSNVQHVRDAIRAVLKNGSPSAGREDQFKLRIIAQLASRAPHLVTLDEALGCERLQSEVPLRFYGVTKSASVRKPKAADLMIFGDAPVDSVQPAKSARYGPLYWPEACVELKRVAGTFGSTGIAQEFPRLRALLDASAAAGKSTVGIITWPQTIDNSKSQAAIREAKRWITQNNSDGIVVMYRHGFKIVDQPAAKWAAAPSQSGG